MLGKLIENKFKETKQRLTYWNCSWRGGNFCLQWSFCPYWCGFSDVLIQWRIFNKNHICNSFVLRGLSWCAIHDGQKDQNCDICSKSFSTKVELTRNIKNVHNKKIEKIEPLQTIKIHTSSTYIFNLPGFPLSIISSTSTSNL